MRSGLGRRLRHWLWAGRRLFSLRQLVSRWGPEAPLRGAAAVCRMLPTAWLRPLANVAGHTVAARAPQLGLGAQRATVARHQRRVLNHRAGSDAHPAPDAAVERSVGLAYASYARYWLESLHTTGLTPQAVEVGFSFTGVEHVEAGLAAGRGVIFALPHLGCWDYAGSWLARAGFRPAVVVEPLQPPEVFEWFAELRQRLGMEVIAAEGPVANRVLRALADNRTVCLPCERDLTGDGVEVTFFGERTTMPGGPAVLALRSGAPLLPTAVYYDDTRGGHLGVVRPPIPVERQGRLRHDVARITQALAHQLEQLILAAPSQWHLFQPNWPSDREPATAPPTPQ